LFEIYEYINLLPPYQYPAIIPPEITVVGKSALYANPLS